MDKWGTVPDWLTTIATLGALAAAVWAGVTAKRIYQIESDRDRAHDEERRSEQAQSVAAWVAAAISNGDEATSYGIVVQNSSTNVIYDVIVASTRKGSGVGEPVKLKVLPPGTYYVESTPSGTYQWRFAVEVSAMRCEIRPITKSQSIGIAGLTFRDSANLRWERADSGSLNPVPTAVRA